MKQCLRVQLLLVFSLMLIPLASFSQSSAARGSSPAPYPKLQSTGNPEVDRANFTKAVKVWQENERKRVESLHSTNPSSTNTSSKVDKEKQDRLHTKEKGVFTPAISGKKQERAMTIIDIPGYPKYITTGNPELDEKNYQVAKAKFMVEHSDLYKKYVDEHSGHSGKLKRASANSSK